MEALSVFNPRPRALQFEFPSLPADPYSGSACLSEFQSAGRGRRGRSWISPFGCNIYLSLYWRFERSMTEVGGVSIAVGSVIAKVLSDSGSGSSAGVLEGVEWCQENGADVISMSLGGGGFSQITSDIYKEI